MEDVFKRIEDNKKQQKEIKKVYKNSLAINGEYQDILDQLEALKLKKKKIEDAIKSEFKEEFAKLDNLKISMTSDNQMLSDLALMQLVDGQEVRIVDENKVEYDPVFTVKFKKN